MFRLTTTTTRKVGFSRRRASTRSSEATTITGSRSEATWSEAAGRSSRFSSFRDSRPKTRCFSQSRHLQLSVSFIHFFLRDFDSVQTFIFILSYEAGIYQPTSLKVHFPNSGITAGLYQPTSLKVHFPIFFVTFQLPFFSPCVDPNEWCMKNSLLSVEFEPKTSLF